MTRIYFQHTNEIISKTFWDSPVCILKICLPFLMCNFVTLKCVMFECARMLLTNEIFIYNFFFFVPKQLLLFSILPFYHIFTFIKTCDMQVFAKDGNCSDVTKPENNSIYLFMWLFHFILTSQFSFQGRHIYKYHLETHVILLLQHSSVNLSW